MIRFAGRHLFLKINLLRKGLTQAISGDEANFDELLPQMIIMNTLGSKLLQ